MTPPVKVRQVRLDRQSSAGDPELKDKQGSAGDRELKDKQGSAGDREIKDRQGSAGDRENRLDTNKRGIGNVSKRI